MAAFSQSKRRSLVCAALLLPTLLILGFLARDGIEYCCDAGTYLKTIAGHRQDGLFHSFAQVGYRPYLFPYLYSLLPFDVSQPAFGEVPVYSLVSTSFFLLVELVVLLRLHGSSLFWPTYLAFFANPLLLVYVPYPISESFLLLAFVGFVPWILSSSTSNESGSFPSLLGLFLGVMYMTRPSNLVLAVPVAFLLLGHLRALGTTRGRVRSGALFALLFAIVVVPQSAVSHRHLGSFAPYPRTDVLPLQMTFGQAYAKYQTDVSGRENQPHPMPSWNPLNCRAQPSHLNVRSTRRFVCSVLSGSRRRDAAAVVFTSLLHVFSALNYDVLEPYSAATRVPVFSFSQLLSMSIVFLGGYAAVRKAIQGKTELRDWFLIATIGVTLAVTTITAVETRFGLLATACLSLLAADLALNGGMDAREWLPVGFGLALFLLVGSLLSVYVLALSGALAP